MAQSTNIAWADATWNPVRGCTRISPGCLRCYAETLSHRNPAVLGQWGPGGARVVGSEANWREPIRWARGHLKRVFARQAAPRPLRIFTASLADVFEDHPAVEGVRDRIWRETLPTLDKLRLRDGSPAAVLLTLTKRAQIARSWYDARGCPDTVWPGVSVEDQRYADARLDIMAGLPRLWISMEPLLGPVQLADAHLAALNWIIVGGESQAGARPMELDWARSLRDQARTAGVWFFLKQLGGHPNARADIANFPADLQIQEVPRG